MTPEVDREILVAEARKIKYGQILEIGTCAGETANALADASPTSVIHTMDIREKPEGLRENVNFIRGDSKDLLGWELPGLIDMLFIDGAHDFNTIKSDFYGFGEWVKLGGKIFLHDYNNGRNADVRRFVDQVDDPAYKHIGPAGEMLYVFERK